MSAIDDWWEATTDRRLLVQRCRECGHVQHYPRPLCTACHRPAVELIESSGRGAVHSFTVVHRSPAKDRPAPYVVALIDLEEGARLLSHVVDCDPSEVRCDMAVQLEWRPHADGHHLPVFAPTR